MKKEYTEYYCDLCRKQVKRESSLTKLQLPDYGGPWPDHPPEYYVCQGCYNRIACTMDLIFENTEKLDAFLDKNGSYSITDFTEE